MRDGFRRELHYGAGSRSSMDCKIMIPTATNWKKKEGDEGLSSCSGNVGGLTVLRGCCSAGSGGPV